MKYILGLLSSTLIFAATANAQKVEFSSSLQNVIDTERAFSKASEDQGTTNAFFAFIADDGILFRPTAVNGKRWMRENPVPPSAKRSLLSWQPAFADISQTGDMAYTTGPWEFKQDIKDVKPVAYGNFVTVWKKQADGTWKFVVDLGISNPQPLEIIAPWQVPANIKQSTNLKVANLDQSSSRAELVKRDWEFSNASETKGALDAFLSYSANDVRLFRNNSYPFVGRKAAKQALATNKNRWTFQPDFADVSRSGDLGYTYGTYELRDPEAAGALTEKGNYLRIWKLQGGEWRVVLDVANPLPPEQKKS
jgi:ketosteroid isomerase-like protein